MYKYEDHKPELFTDDGQRMFLRIRDFVHETIEVAGAVSMGKAMSAARGGNSWGMMACVDRMVELGEIREVEQVGEVAGQNRIFTKR